MEFKKKQSFIHLKKIISRFYFEHITHHRLRIYTTKHTI